MEIDLNADLGEGAGHDAELMPLVTSANVCCGGYAGGPVAIRDTLALAKRYGVTVGAHPGYPDRLNFGRVELADLPGEDLYAHLHYQVGGLIGVAQLPDDEVEVKYLKLHGALYHAACRDIDIAYLVPSLVVDFAYSITALAVVGLPDSVLEAVCREAGIPFVPEGFADRRYKPDGSLVPRTEPDAFVHDPAEAVRQVEWLVREKGVRTVCVHGDNPDAVAFTRAVRDGLLAHGFVLKPFA